MATATLDLRRTSKMFRFGKPINIHIRNYGDFPKFSDTDFYCIHPKIQVKKFCHSVILQKDADRITNSDVLFWSGSALFAKPCQDTVKFLNFRMQETLL